MIDSENITDDRLLNTRWGFAYRRGYFKALIDIYNLLESCDGRMTKKDALSIIRAAQNNPDILMMYGDTIIVKCISWDKKTKKPTAYELTDKR